MRYYEFAKLLEDDMPSQEKDPKKITTPHPEKAADEAKAAQQREAELARQRKVMAGIIQRDAPLFQALSKK